MGYCEVTKRLYEEGFIWFDGVTFSHSVLERVLDKSNYGPPIIEHFNACYDKNIDEETGKMITAGLPKEIRDILPVKSWIAKYVTKGHQFPPHRDAIVLEPNCLPGPAAVVIWITPNEYEGRELACGRIKDQSIVPEHWDDNVCTDIGFDDPNLELVYEKQPKTGMGVLIDRQNLEWWHGVREMKSDDTVIVLVGSW